MATDLRIFYTVPADPLYDGEEHLYVVLPNEESQLPGETLPAWLDRVAAKVVPPGCFWRQGAAQQLPETRAFRNAWRDTGSGPIIVPVVEAHKVQRARLEALRRVALDRLRSALEAAQDLGDADRADELADLRRRTNAPNLYAGLDALDDLDAIATWEPAALAAVIAFLGPAG